MKIILLLSILLSQLAFSDAVEYPWDEAVKKANSVIEGEIIKIKLLDDEEGLYKATVKVSKVLKGPNINNRDVIIYYYYVEGLEIGLPEIKVKDKYTMCLYWSQLLNSDVFTIKYQSDLKEVDKSSIPINN
jgi:hypothetical protein